MRPALRQLWPYAWRYRASFGLGLACALINTGISLLAPWILKLAVDDLAVAVTRGRLALYAGAIVLVHGVAGLFRFWMRRITIGASRHIEFDMQRLLRGPAAAAVVATSATAPATSCRAPRTTSTRSA
jgi:ATP-binding cassette subfamily B protein